MADDFSEEAFASAGDFTLNESPPLLPLAETRSEYREILDLRGVWRQKIRELEAAESKQNKEV